VFGILSFLMIFTLGFKERKGKRALHYLNPLFTLTDLVVPVSIALRMFGSVFCGFLIMDLIYALLPSWILYTGIIAAFGNVMFTMFHALIQSYVFMFLSMCLINEATE
jgi:F-type H+-transporting ATPase subunit a